MIYNHHIPVQTWRDIGDANLARKFYGRKIKNKTLWNLQANFNV